MLRKRIIKDKEETNVISEPREGGITGVALLHLEVMVMMVVIAIIQLFIIYVPSQQLQGQLQTQHSVDNIYIHVA
jgi:hypothetical protein